MDPSITSTNGASSLSSSASRNGLRNSSPPSVGDSTLLCRCTFGRPGIAPSRTSSMLGWPAAVMETVSPSQDIPSEIHRMWTSSTPPDTGSVVAMDPSSRRRRELLHVQRGDLELLASQQFQVQPAAAPAVQREAVELGHVPAGAAAAGGGHEVDVQLDRAVR